ncbi:MAG: cardiolipin synthase ClsB [Bordetella sp.]|nr:MAG: cardiolipin synthase ClsB [Bordetella sp.]
MKGEIDQLNWTSGNSLTLLNGVNFFSALCSSIDSAEISIHLETYIFCLDKIGLKVLKSLENAAYRNVKVRVVLDGFGCLSTATLISKRLSSAGVQCRIYRPEPRYLGRFIPSRRRLRRLHRKVTVIDSNEAFIGGINISGNFDQTEDSNSNSNLTVQKLDFAVKIKGPLVYYVVHAQDRLWLGLNWTKLHFKSSVWRYMKFLRSRHDIKTNEKQLNCQKAALVLRDNIRYRQTFERVYLHAIKEAHNEIIIANAYFLPREKFIKELALAVSRGVRVRLLLQGKAEYRMQYRATRAIYRQLFLSGVEIYEYMPSILHAKVAVIDNIGFIGSSNLDPFSLLLAREANVIVDDQLFVENLKHELEVAIQNGGHHVEQITYEHRGVLHRIVDAFSYRMFRFGISLTGSTNDY